MSPENAAPTRNATERAPRSSIPLGAGGAMGGQQQEQHEGDGGEDAQGAQLAAQVCRGTLLDGARDLVHGVGAGSCAQHLAAEPQRHRDGDQGDYHDHRDRGHARCGECDGFRCSTRPPHVVVGMGPSLPVRSPMSTPVLVWEPQPEIAVRNTLPARHRPLAPTRGHDAAPLQQPPPRRARRSVSEAVRRPAQAVAGATSRSFRFRPRRTIWTITTAAARAMPTREMMIEG